MKRFLKSRILAVLLTLALVAGSCGITAALVLTGETKIADAENAEECDKPDLMLESLASADLMMFGE